MEKVDISAIWRGKQEVSGEDKWMKTGSEGEYPRLRPSLSVDADPYSLAWRFPGYYERCLFIFGFGGQLAFAALSSGMISRFVRNRFYLSGSVANLMSAYGAVSMGTIMTAVAIDRITMHSLYCNDQSQICFPCLQLKQVVANIGTTVALPAVMVLPESLYHGLRDPGYAGSVPRITEGRRLWKFVSEKYRGGLIRKFGVLSLVSCVVTTAGTYMLTKGATRIALSIDDDPTLVSSLAQERRENVLHRIKAWFKSIIEGS